MKKTLAIALTLMLALSVAACGKTEPTVSVSTEPTVSTSTSVVTSVEEVEKTDLSAYEPVEIEASVSENEAEAVETEVEEVSEEQKKITKTEAFRQEWGITEEEQKEIEKRFYGCPLSALVNRHNGVIANEEYLATLPREEQIFLSLLSVDAYPLNIVKYRETGKIVDESVGYFWNYTEEEKDLYAPVHAARGYWDENWEPRKWREVCVAIGIDNKYYYLMPDGCTDDYDPLYKFESGFDTIEDAWAALEKKYPDLILVAEVTQEQLDDWNYFLRYQAQ